MEPSYPMIDRLADQVGRDRPGVQRLVENANMFPSCRGSVYRILQGMLKEKEGVSLGSEPAFPVPSSLPGEGQPLGRLLSGDTLLGEYRFPVSALAGNAAIYGCSGTGKSSLAGLLIEGWLEDGPKVIMLDVADEYGWLIHRVGADRLSVIRARHFPVGLFVNPPGSCLSQMAYLSAIVGVLRESLYLRDGSCNFLVKMLAEVYRERGVLDGTRDHPTLAEVFRKLLTCKYSVQTRTSGFVETLVNRIHSLLISFPGMNAKRSLSPEEVTRKHLIVRMADLSPAEMEVFTGVFLCWLMAYRGGKI
jgi:hypothetical protein